MFALITFERTLLRYATVRSFSQNVTDEAGSGSGS